MNTKCLITVLIDASGSMLNTHKNTGHSKLDLVNRELTNFFSDLKNDITLCSKIQVCIISIKEEATVNNITNLADFDFQNIITESGVDENVGVGVLTGIDQIEKWKRRDFYTLILKQNYTPYLLLITDLDKPNLIKQDNSNPFKQKVLSIVQKEKIKFFAIGLGDADLESMFPIYSEYSYVSNSPKFDIVLQKIKKDLSVNLQLSRPFKEEIAIFSKYIKKIKALVPWIRKNCKAIGLTLFSIALVPFSFSIFEINAINIEIEKIEINSNNKIEEYKKEYPSNNIYINIKNKPNGIYWVNQNIYCVFRFEQKISNYKLGEYSPYSSIEVQKAIELMVNNIIEIDKNMHISGNVFVKITGETDAYKITPNTITYKGEFGDLYDKEYFNERTKKWSKMNIRSNEYVNDNTLLAFLRGYSLWDYMRRRVDVLIYNKTDYQQIVTLNDQNNNKGGSYRTTKLELIIQDVELKN